MSHPGCYNVHNTHIPFYPMKKTLILLLALGHAALAYTNETIIYGETGTTNPWDYGSYLTHANGDPATGTSGTYVVSSTTISGIGCELSHSRGRTWCTAYPADASWNNSTALSSYNSATGHSLSATQLLDTTFSSSHGGSAYTRLTLSFDATQYQAGDVVTLYALVAGYESKLSGLTATGLANATYLVARGNGTGFSDAADTNNWALTQYPNLVRITGTLTADGSGIANIVLAGNSAKSGFAALTIIVAAPDLYWKGTELSGNNWSDASWAESSTGSGTLIFAAGATAHFIENDLGGTVEITVPDGVDTAGINVSGGAYAFTGSCPLDTADSLIISGGSASFDMAVQTGSLSLSSGTLSARTLTATGAVSISGGTLELTAGDTQLTADSISPEALILGSDATAATLTISGALNMQGSITLGHADSALTAGSLADGSPLNFLMSEQQLLQLGSESVLLTLNQAATSPGTLSLNGASTITIDKYAYDIRWSSDKLNVLVLSSFHSNYYNDNARTANGAAGAGIITAIVSSENPQVNAADSPLAQALNSLDALIDAGQAVRADKLMAAIAGCSTAAMGAAFAGDMHRQLRAIRNRTTTMGVDQSVENNNLPYVNAWVNAEVDYQRLDQHGTRSGYTLNSWGGTVGFDVDISPELTSGLAFTAMYGDFSSRSEDHAHGDLNSWYLSLFARYAARRWTHTLILSLGRADSSLRRTVRHSNGSYSTRGDSDGTSLGFLYELGYLFILNEEATACLQPLLNLSLVHSHLDGYTEKGGNGALRVGSMDMTTGSLGAGVRFQATAGETLWNYPVIFESRALLKLYIGDTGSAGSVALAALPGNRRRIRSADAGRLRAELGAGLTVPLMQGNAALFLDAAAGFAKDNTELNATVGCRLNF